MIEPFDELTTPDYRDLRESKELSRGSRIAIKEHARGYVNKERRLDDWAVIRRCFPNDYRYLKQKIVNAIIIAELVKIPVTIENKFSIFPRGKWRHV